MHEYESPQTSLRPWIESWAGKLPEPLRYCPLPEAVLPGWDEVQQILEAKGAAPETLAALRAFYDELTRSDTPDFLRLANELDSYLR